MLSLQQQHQCLFRLAEKSKAGVPLHAWPDGEDAGLKARLRSCFRAVERGEVPLSRALAEALELNAVEEKIVEATEFSGRLPDGFSALANAKKNQQNATRKLWWALAYPGFLLVFASVVLPLPVLVSSPLTTYLSFAVPGLLCVGLLVFSAWFWPTIPPSHPLKKWVGAHVVQLPFLRSLFREAATMRFAQTLGDLLATGIAPVTSLPMAILVAQHPSFFQASDDVEDSLDQGLSLAKVLSRLPALPDSFLREVEHSEHTGHPDQALLDLAKKHGARRQTMQMTLLAITVFVAGALVVGAVGYAMVKGTQSYFEQIDAIIEDAS